MPGAEKEKGKLYRESRIIFTVPHPVKKWIEDEAKKTNEHPVIFLRRALVNLYKEANPVEEINAVSLEMEDATGKKGSKDYKITHPGIE